MHARTMGTSGRRRATLGARAVVILVVAGLVGGVVSSGAAVPPDGAEVTYAATQVIPPPPSPTFSASIGGDTWGVAFYGDNVYSVFHHKSDFTIACRNTFTTTACDGYAKTITNPGSSSNYSTGQFEAMWIDQSTGYLYAWAVQTSDHAAGVLAVDLNSADANPFVSFTALSAAGEALNADSSLSSSVLVGTRWYALNFKPGVYSGTQNTMMCFDVATLAACSGQPYAVPDLPSTPGTGYAQYPPMLTQLGTKILMPLAPNTTNWVYTGAIYCFDAATDGDCGGAWPVTPPPASPNITNTPAGIPVLDADGVQYGTCFATFDSSYSDAIHPNVWCYDADGGFLTSESATIGTVLDGSASNPWNNAPIVLGSRVYVPQGNEWSGLPSSSSQVVCFDWATGAACPGFPKYYSGYAVVNQMYTVMNRPDNPSCIWQVAHAGTSQIMTFDAYTGDACGLGGTRVQMGQFVSPATACRPTSYTRLTITSPVPSGYTDGTVTFQDASGQPIPGVAPQPIVNGVVDLSSLNLSTAHGLPQMLVDLPGASEASITMSIQWSGAYHEECTAEGQDVTYTPAPDPGPVPEPTFTG